MKLAFDGGAFQQGIAAGIFNVAIGLLNAIVKIRPHLSIVLVADPRLGPIRKELVSHLSFDPEIIEAAVSPAYKTHSPLLTTDDAKIYFEVDGVNVPGKLSNDDVVYSGAAPTRSFRIRSRADSPKRARGQSDTRRLGVAVSRIAIRAGKKISIISPDDARLVDGFHQPETTHRWTDGDAAIPLSLFPIGQDEIEVVIGLAGSMTYRLGGESIASNFKEISERIEHLNLLVETSRLERKLIETGASLYIVNHFIPAQFKTLPVCAILYDMIPVLFRDYFLQDARDNFSHNLTAFRNSKHVFSISETSRRDLINLEGASSARVSTMLIDADSSFKPKSSKEVVEARTRHGLSRRPYIVAVGTLEPRKNHVRLVEAFTALATGGAPPCDLAIIGKFGWGTEGLVEAVAASKFASRIHFLTAVSNDDLAALYSGALFSVYPSLYEGFGLPVLEAMACGCPVMTSDRSSMKEIAGDAALLIDPTEVSSIVKGLYTLLTNGELRQKLSARGRLQRQRFSWDISAAHVLRVLERQ